MFGQTHIAACYYGKQHRCVLDVLPSTNSDVPQQSVESPALARLILNYQKVHHMKVDQPNTTEEGTDFCDFTTL